MTNIPCGTRGGVLIYFDKVEVVNRLAKDHVVDTGEEIHKAPSEIRIGSQHAVLCCCRGVD